MSPSSGFAEVLIGDGSFALMRLHLPEEKEQPGRIVYAVLDGEKLVHSGAESKEASDAFDQATRHRGDRLGDNRAGRGRENFLETCPTDLSTLRGQAFSKLAEQLPEVRHVRR